MKILLAVMLVVVSISGCAVFKQNTYKLQFTYKPTDKPFDMNGEINGAGLRDLGRDLAWVVNNLKEKIGK